MVTIAIIEEKGAPKELLSSYTGILYPGTLCSPETFQVLDSFEARSDDVILATYPKNGTNWLDQVLNDLETTAAKYTEEEIKERINITNELSLFPRLEFGDPEKFKEDNLHEQVRISPNLTPIQKIEATDVINRDRDVFSTKPGRTTETYHHICTITGAKVTLRPYRISAAKREEIKAEVKKMLELGVIEESYSHWSSPIILVPKSDGTTRFCNDFCQLNEISQFNAYPISRIDELVDRLVCWGSYFDYLVEWNKHMDDENVMAITYEELKEHLPPQVLPKSIFKSKAKILLLVRNLKDTAVSYFHFYNNIPTLPSFGSWDEYFTAFMHGKLCWGSYFDYLVEWNKHMDDENVMAITYEELKENQTLGLKKIADFFGFSLSEEEIQTVAEKSSFKAMKEKSSKTHGAFGKIFFRKGIIGDWKDHFSEAQNKEMDRKFEECLAGTKLGEKMKYGLYCKA
nr:sulfotransferase 6B1-like [Chrysemys picta bellii]